MSINSVGSQSGYTNTTTDIDHFVARQVFQQFFNCSPSWRNSQSCACYFPTRNAPTSSSSSRNPSMDGRPSSQSLLVSFCSTTSLAPSFAFDSYDALFFHVPTWFSPDGQPRIGPESGFSCQQTVLNLFSVVALNVRVFPLVKRGMRHHVPLLRTPVDNCIIFTLNNQKKTVANIHILLAQRDLDHVTFKHGSSVYRPNRKVITQTNQILRTRFKSIVWFVSG